METPVLLDPSIEVLYEGEDYVAVDKPPSMPVHEGGSYKFNTLMGILEGEMGFKGLKCVNRLDKQTSGVVFLARNEKTANDFREGLLSDAVEKEYFARVAGNFGEEEKTVRKWIYMKEYKTMLHDCEEEANLTADMKKTAKDAETRFKLEKYCPESDTSIVKCFPKTGRTHQIRVHLMSLGFPIANDMVYGGKVLNDGSGREKEWEQIFQDCYQGEDAKESARQPFLMLWLHAYRYKFKDIEVLSKVPKWAC